MFKEKFESHSRKTLSRRNTKDGYICYTSHIMWKALQSENGSLSFGDHRGSTEATRREVLSQEKKATSK
jgi:hypothetical protein